MNSKSNSIFSAVFWNLLERLGTQGAQLVVSIVLARILLPEAYGILALTTVFVNLATVVVETGFGSSIIQKKDIKTEQINTVFTFNLLISLALCGILWICAPLIASFYSNYDFSLLTRVIRIYSFILPIGALTSTQSAVIYRDMQFRKFFFINIAVILISSAVGIGMACAGAGMWALVFQHLSAKLALLIVQLFFVEWKPRLNFRFKESGALFKFGSNVLFNRLLNMLYNQISSLLIGKQYTSDMLAFYSKGQTFPSIIATNTDYALQKVMFSAYSKQQDDVQKVKKLMRKTFSLSTFLLAPLLFGMLACAQNITRVLLTDKWLPSVMYMQIFSLSFFFQPFATTATQAFNGIGKSDLTLRMGVATRIVGIIVVIATVPFGVLYVALGVLMTSLASTVGYMCLNRKVFGYSFKEQLADVVPNTITAVIMAVLCVGVGKICSGFMPIWTLLLQLLTGAVFYVGASVLFKNQNMKYLLDKVQSFRK